MVDLDLKRLSITDAGWLAALHKKAFDPPWSERSFADLLALPTVYGWTLENKPCLILLQLSNEEAEILTFQVGSEIQRQGLGRTLLLKAVKEILALGATSIYLDVSESRKAAKALYLSQGFEVIGRRKGYYRTKNGREDALICKFQRKMSTVP